MVKVRMKRFDFIKYPNSKYSRAIEAKNSQDTEKLMVALLKMHQEDPDMGCGTE